MPLPFEPRFVDLVRNFSTSVGTGNFTLGPVVTGFTGFTAALSTGDRFYYSAINADKVQEREIGRGTLLAGGAIAREVVTGPLTQFTAGTKTIALVAAADWFAGIGAALPAIVPTFADIAASALPAAVATIETSLNGKRARFIRDPDQSANTAIGQALINAATLSQAQVSAILDRIRVQDSNDVYWVLDTSGEGVRIEHFGATAGGGDDTAAIQAALDFAGYWGTGPVRAGLGSFTVSAALTMQSGAQLSGSGHGTVLQFSGAGSPHLISLISKSDVTIADMRLVPQTSGTNRAAIYADLCQRITVRDVAIMGHTDATGVWLIDCDDCIIDHLYFDGGASMQAYAAYLAGCKRCRLANSTAYRPNFGFVIVGQDIQPLSDRVSSEAYGNTIIGCHVSNHDGHAFDINSAWGNIVSGCSAEDYAGVSTNVAFQNKHSSSDNSENNIFIGCTAKDVPSGFGAQQGQGAQFIGCSAYNTSNYGFLLNSSDHSNLIGCVAREFGIAGIYIASTSAGTIINGAQLETATPSAKGIVLDNGGGTVSSTFIDNVQMYGAMAAAVDIASSVQNTRFGHHVNLGGNSVVDGTTTTVWAERYTSITTVPTDSFLGRDSAGTGNAEAMSVATAKTLLGLAGSNSGDQTITLTGDVAGSGGGSFVATIAASAVTFAKMQNVSAATRLLGRGSAGGAGAVQELTLGAKLSLAGTVLSATPDWTETTLASDYTQATTTFTTITDGTSPLTYTPPASSNFELHAVLLIQTVTTTNLPRIGVSVAAQGAGALGCVQIDQTGASATTRVTADGSFTTTAINVQTAAGDLPAANSPYMCFITVRGKSGAAPAAINLQMACETAVAAICFVKAGSQMRTKAS